MLILLATENEHKSEEVRAIIKETGDLETELQTLADYPHLKLPPETGSSYRENALEKAHYAARETGLWALGDDSGLEVTALDGAPGLYSARYAGLLVSYKDNNAKLIAALKNVPEEKRTARFICTVALVSPKGGAHVFEHKCEGRITATQSGQEGFGYDPIFFLPDYGKTFAELSASEKNRVSHRGQAIRATMIYIKNLKE